jgi:hypothetical protein
MNEADTKVIRSTVHPKIGCCDASMRDVMTARLEPPNEHTSPKVGEDLKNIRDQRIELGIGECRHRAGGGGVTTSGGSVLLPSGGIDRLARLGKAVLEGTSADGACRTLENGAEVGCAAKLESVR